MDDFARLLGDLGSGGKLRGIIHLWSLETAENSALTLEALDAARRLSVESTMRLVQSLAASTAIGPM